MKVVPGHAPAPAARSAVEQRVERRVHRAVAEPPVRVGPQLVEPLVVRVERVEERDRVGGVDQHRQAQLAGEREHRDHARVVGQDERAGRVADGQPEVLPHLDARGRRAAAASRSCAASSPVAVRRCASSAQSSWQNVRNRPGCGAVVAVEVGLELVAPIAVEVDHRLDVAAVHQREQRRRRRRPSSAGRRSASGRGGCARRRTGTAGCGPPRSSVRRACWRGCQSRQAKVGGGGPVSVAIRTLALAARSVRVSVSAVSLRIDHSGTQYCAHGVDVNPVAGARGHP